MRGRIERGRTERGRTERGRPLCAELWKSDGDSGGTKLVKGMDTRTP